MNETQLDPLHCPSAEEKASAIQRVYDFLAKAQVYYLATVEQDQPRVRPFGTVDVFEGRLYIQTGKKKAVSQQLHQNSRAELCACIQDRWLRLSGELIPDDRLEAKQHMLDAYPSLKAMYSPTDDNTEVFYFQNAKASFCSFQGEPEELSF